MIEMHSDCPLQSQWCYTITASDELVEFCKSTYKLNYCKHREKWHVLALNKPLTTSMI